MQTLIRGLLTHRHEKRWVCGEVSRFLAGEDEEEVGYCISGKFIFDKNGVVTPDGKTVIPFEYDSLCVFDEERSVYKARIDGEYQYITETDVLFKGELLRVRQVRNNPFEVIDNDYWRTKLYSRDFRLIKEFDEGFHWGSDWIVHVEQNGLWGIADGAGNVIVPIQYDKIYRHDNFFCSSKGKMGFVQYT